MNYQQSQSSQNLLPIANVILQKRISIGPSYGVLKLDTGGYLLLDTGGYLKLKLS